MNLKFNIDWLIRHEDEFKQLGMWTPNWYYTDDYRIRFIQNEMETFALFSQQGKDYRPEVAGDYYFTDVAFSNRQAGNIFGGKGAGFGHRGIKAGNLNDATRQRTFLRAMDFAHTLNASSGDYDGKTLDEFFDQTGALSVFRKSMEAQLLRELVRTAPVLSGNLRHNIKARKTTKRGFGIIKISGPSYSVPFWRCTKRVRLTKKYDYAMWLEKVGAFGRKNGSQGWVRRAVASVVNDMAMIWDADVVDLGGYNVL